MKGNLLFAALFSGAILLHSCESQNDGPKPFEGLDQNAKEEPLKSWTDGQAKRRIISFVERATQKGGPDFIPLQDRIAVYDNDGTLWNEKPLYVQVAYAFESIRQKVAQDPSLKSDPVFKAIAEGNREVLAAMGEDKVIPAIIKVQDIPSAEFSQSIAAWFKEARHPRYDRPYSDITYLPMVELLEYMESNGFKNFICTGGGIEFVRNVSESLYDIQEERVIGSSIKYLYDESSNRVERIAEMSSVNDKAGKPENIMLHIGKVPVVAVGNSDGDFQMMRYSETSRHPSLQLLVHHDDAKREYAYTHGAENAQRYCATSTWQKVSMNDDFKRVFSWSD